ncbi:MAG: hypothetical protein U1F43_37865 [Myxococcota bacterium]
MPACIFDASTRGSGKSLQADVIAMVTTGRTAPRMSWPGDEIELEKVLAAYALGALASSCSTTSSRRLAAVRWTAR